MINRRDFLNGVLATGTTLAASALPATGAQQGEAVPALPGARAPKDAHGKAASVVDFRYAPVKYQTAFCFPDDPHKSLVSETGQLLYGYKFGSSTLASPLKVGFTLYGMQPAKLKSQQLESPSIPIVRTVLEYPSALMTLTTFATNDPAEGRVDNVFVEVTPHSDRLVSIQLPLEFDSNEVFDFEVREKGFRISHRNSREVFMVGKAPASQSLDNPLGDVDSRQRMVLHRGQASKSKPYRAFFRFPLAKQETGPVEAGLSTPERCLESCRSFWKSWSAFRKPVAVEVPGRQGEFVEACARNILQAREVRDGKLTFQVGPTCYRGLWVVDGNFLLEAARYMGYDKDAEEGLRTTWSGQLKSGQVVTAGISEHWKDTAIAMFTLIRQCELGQDWSLMHELEPQVVHAIEFLRSLQATARHQDSALGRYGLLPMGFADGGLGGVRDEFTNTLWALAGLKAVAESGERQRFESLKDARALHSELEAAFLRAAPGEMRRFETGFEYLPMSLKNDPEWELPDPWDRPLPQSAQWALSHAIFPGRVFDPQHPIVRGHVQLMQAVTKEDVPAETGWGRHESIWSYNAAFVAEVYLWLGMKQAARDTFIGFLNHASPEYCWREEQPFQNALVGSYTGDMPHNWASAECIRYVRHMLALEDGSHLRLLAGVTGDDLKSGKGYVLAGSPTRFGRINMKLESLDRDQGWRLAYERGTGPAPHNLSLPLDLGARTHFTQVEGAHHRTERGMVLIDGEASRWTAFWKT